MPNLPNFEIPAVINPEKTRCIQIEIPDDETWVRNFVGILSMPMFWFNWQRTGDTSGKQCADVWFALFQQIDWSNMSCCPDILYQINPDGTISISTDGGATYHPAGNSDPRKTAPQLPPLGGSSGDSKKCSAANNVVRQIKDVQAGNSNNIGTVSTIAEMALLAAGLAVLVFFTAGIATYLVGLFFELAGALLTTTKTAYDAEFDSDVWNDLLCELFCNIGDDGIFTQTNFSDISAWSDDHYSGNVALTITSTLIAWQLEGLNNAARIATSDNLSCAGCSCAGCNIDLWDYFDGDSGTTVSKDTTTWEIAANIRGDGQYYIIICAPTSVDCCTWVWSPENTWDQYSVALCGEDPQSVVLGLHQNSHGGDPVTAFLFKKSTPFTLTGTLIG